MIDGSALLLLMVMLWMIGETGKETGVRLFIDKPAEGAPPRPWIKGPWSTLSLAVIFAILTPVVTVVAFRGMF